MDGWMWTIGNWKIADTGSGRPIGMCQKQVEDTVAPRGQKGFKSDCERPLGRYEIWGRLMCRRMNRNGRQR